jgi:hypothetical protein
VYLNGTELRQIGCGAMVSISARRSAHLRPRRLVERADPATMTSFEAKSAEPIAP